MSFGHLKQISASTDNTQL